MPWSIFNRPSIQLGTLKGFLQQDEEISIDTFHPYLGLAKSLGIESYQYICSKSWAGEALYGALLFPDRVAQAKKVFKKSCADNTKFGREFQALRTIVESHLNNWITETDFSKYALIGFSVCFSQLFASLSAAKKIKSNLPNSTIIFGGSSCVGEIGTSLLQQFPQIDYVVDGEGEIPLRNLCHFLLRKQDFLPQQVHSRTEKSGGPYTTIRDLNTLPIPDYTSYFQELNSLFPDQPFIPRLPLEFSRGCWWRKCTFCNLNLQWQGYRWKTSRKMMSELLYLTKKHQCLDFTFCDNALPENETAPFFQKCWESGKDFRFFAEIRNIKQSDKLALYRNGGLTTVQVGIESFSNSLLQKMKKGTSVIENLAIMKHCLENNIQLEGNLIVEFPGSSKTEIEETLRNLDYAIPFNPLTAASFFLGFGSPMEKQPHKFGISGISHHRNNKSLLPEHMLESMEMLIKDFRGDKIKQKDLWKPVIRKLKMWRNFHEKRQDKTIAPLSYRDGGTFIVVRQEQLQGKPLLHRLQGQSRQLYLYCRSIRTLEEILHHFSTLKEKTVLNFFDDLSNKSLLFRENNTFLALAVHLQKPARQ